MYKFELPLNERTRRLLSIENIFLRLKSQINSCRADFSEIGCFELYFIMRGTASRADMKIEITQELEKLIIKKKQLKKTKKNIDQIKKLMDAKKGLDKVNLPQGNFFGNDKFLQEIKTSSLSPTGIVSSDLPQLQLWLKQLSPKAKQQYFYSKIDPYLPIFSSITTYLNTLRDSVTLESIESNENGLVNYQLNPSFKHDFIQLQLPQKLNLYPNLTSNKYTINIQFSSLTKNTNPGKKIKFKMGVSQQ
jgi:cell division protein ZapD